LIVRCRAGALWQDRNPGSRQQTFEQVKKQRLGRQFRRYRGEGFTQ
jgi:hypothetical protein